MSGAALADLRDRLGQLGKALDAGDLGWAAQLTTGYDIALRRYVEGCGPTSIPALQDLLRMQNSLLARMEAQHAATGGELRRLHQADAASRAYTAAGSAR
ncbi:hypothetical protein BGP89_12275 [Luteimonas sp. JM171]|uniref:hypothetical protein n=1 Tax=Luteimonas sp. JM171 TaxID=1896164 RepID=UPI0008561DE6|nr:hypothetical protein [Luteimonas sp. JM171]AOH37029.1 hypothetical protein BGP89_12275 [Luteimonas sp. JM171]